jgi:septum formation protein
VTEKYLLQPYRALCLASTSRYRRELLSRLRLRFDIEAPEVDETALPHESPRELSVRLAAAKARAVAARHPGALVIGSDQVCALGDEILGKPGTLEAHHAMLARLSGRTAVFHTAVAIVGIDAGFCREHVDDTRCVFRTLNAAEIAAYCAAEPALDCAGGFKCEGLGISLLAGFEARDPTAIQGLPLIWVADALRSADAPRVPGR